MLTREAIKLITLFIGVFAAAVALGSFALLAISFAPLFFLLLGLLIDQPRSVEIAMRPIKGPVWTGALIEIQLRITVSGGMGEITLYQRLPPDMDLVDGSNFLSRWKGPGETNMVLSYKVRCPKRGSYQLNPVEWESRHFMGMTQAVRGKAADTAQDILVKPRIVNISRIRGEQALASSASPVIDIARIGVTTTDFREIRQYVPGDPVRHINWKATARRAGRGAGQPLVNDYEVEGKKAIWIFLDASSYLEVGTTVENAFEYCLEAASGVAYYYIDRGYRVGMYMYNGPAKLVHPDSGRKQFNRIWGEITHARAFPLAGSDTLPQAVDRCKKHIMGYNPMCIIITSIESRSLEGLTAGIRKIASMRRRLRRKLPVMVIGIEGYRLIPSEGAYDDNAAELMHLETAPLAGKLRSLGASVLEWNPRQVNLGTALLRQVKAR